MSKTRGPDKTLLAHHARPASGPVNRPVYRSSTVTFRTLAALEAAAQQKEAYIYGRTGNPNSHDFESALTALEQGYGTVTAPSGLAACTMTLLACAGAGDHILVTDSVYGPARRFCDQTLKALGVETEYYDPLLGDSIRTLFRPNTRVLYMESPGSKTYEIQDVPALAAAARTHHIVTVIDNTWATPLLFKPLTRGVDISLHAATKYIGGHSDIFVGAAVCATEEIYKKVKSCAYHLGLCAAPDELWLALRGLRTLEIRLRQHEENARLVMDWLRTRTEVAHILCPALPDNPGHALWKRDFKGSNGLFTMALRPVSAEAVARFIDGLDYFPLGYSWGGYESLIIPALLAGERTATRPADEGPLLRLHIGLEDPEDLIADLQRGFERMAS